MSSIFKLPAVGKLGRRPMDRQYMIDIEARARRMKLACRAQPAPKENKQMNLNFGGKRE